MLLFLLAYILVDWNYEINVVCHTVCEKHNKTCIFHQGKPIDNIKYDELFILFIYDGFLFWNFYKTKQKNIGLSSSCFTAYITLLVYKPLFNRLNY